MSDQPATVSRRSLFRTASLGLAATPALSLLHPELMPFAMAKESGALAAQSDDASENTHTFPIRILYNENPLGCSPLARKALQQIAVRTQFYPFDLAAKLKAALRAKHGMPQTESADGLQIAAPADEGDHGIVLGCGSSEILNAAAMAYSMQGGNIVEPAPSYQAIGSKAVSRPGSAIERRRVPLTKSGTLDVDELLSACDAKTRMLVITNPNNPTGNALAPKQLRRLVKRTPDHVLLFVDEAYIDFLKDPESQSAVRLALERDNVLVARTFSKIHGLAALRCGYAIGHREILSRLEPFQMGLLSLNACGLAAALASLSDREFQTRSRLMASHSRKRISLQLRSLGFEVISSHGACLWADWGRDTSGLVERLAADGVLIASGTRWEQPNCVRISVGTEWQTSQLLDRVTNAVETA